MADNKNEHVVIALFDTEDFANYGINLLEQWDREDTTVKLGAIGVISKQDGKVKTRAPRRAGGGAKLGLILGGIAAVLTGGTSILVGVMGGALLGSAAGALAKKSLRLTKDEIQTLGNELDRGRVAVVVTCDEFEIEPTSQKLTQYGGDVKGYEVAAAALAEAAATETALLDEPETSASATNPAPSADQATPAASAAAIDPTPSADQATPAASAPAIDPTPSADQATPAASATT